MTTLPNYEWFVNRVVDKIVTNTFSGSNTYGSSEHGCINATTLNYRVCAVDPEGKTAHFLCEIWLSAPLKDGGKKTPLNQAEFSLTPEGLSGVQSLINEAITKNEPKE